MVQEHGLTILKTQIADTSLLDLLTTKEIKSVKTRQRASDTGH